MASTTASSVTVTKLDAARRQIDTALDLWFHEGDPISVHTLVAAAHRVVDDIAKLSGDGATLLDSKLLTASGYDAKVVKKLIREAETFFKHAQNDPHDSCTLNYKETEFIFCSAIECYGRVAHSMTPIMSTFMLWFRFQYPDALPKLARDKFAEVIPRAQKLSRPEFLQQLGHLNLQF